MCPPIFSMGGWKIYGTYMSQFLGDIRYTPEIYMETKNEGLEDDFPFQSIQGVVFTFFAGLLG